MRLKICKVPTPGVGPRQPAPAWWIAAVVVGTCYVVFLGRGIQFAH